MANRLNLWRKITFPRQPIQNVLFVGFGGLLVLAVAVVLYLGLTFTSKLTKDYHQILIGTALNKLQNEVETLLLPAEYQSHWLSDQVKNGNLDISNYNEVETFIRGMLGSTPSVTGAGILYKDGYARYLRRDSNDWVVKKETTDEENKRLFELMKGVNTSRWGRLLWFGDLQQTIIDVRTPLFQDGELKGVLFIGVTVANLSQSIMAASTDQYLTPFVLYGNDHLLAHPLLINGRTVSDELGKSNDWIEGKSEIPLPKVNEFQDIKLARLLSKDVVHARLISPIDDVIVNTARIGDEMYIVATRPLHRFGEKPWITGVYINAAKSDQTQALQLFKMAGAGFVVLLISIILSMKVGRKIARPIIRLSEVARSIRMGIVDDVASLPRSRLRELDQAALAFNDMVDGLKERDMIREVFGRYVPESIASSLMQESGELKPISTQATILFSDVQGFTKLTEEVGAERIVAILNAYFSAVVSILEKHGGVVTQFQGDAVLATFNVPIKSSNHGENALRAAMEIRDMMARTKFDGISLKSRIGINTGTVVAGAVGAEGRLNYTVHGDAVNLAARIESLNKIYKTDILISENTAKLIKNIELKSIGTTEVRGRLAGVHLYVIKD